MPYVTWAFSLIDRPYTTWVQTDFIYMNMIVSTLMHETIYV